MITVIARWEEAQMPPQVEWQLWRQLRGAFKIDRLIFTPVLLDNDAPETGLYHVEQYDTMAEALASTMDERVFLEQTGYNPVINIPQTDIVLITGNTEQSNIEYAKVNETYSIASPQRTALYPTEAAAIALAIRYGQ
jgi:hypothetical protein